MQVIVVTGMPGAGKEEFVHVARSLGYDVVRMGDVVRAEAKRQGITGTDKGVGGFADQERRLNGLDVWAERSLPQVRSERTIIDGSRGLDELEIFRQAFGKGVLLVAIHSSPPSRYQRLKRRGRADAPASWSEFEVRDQRELSWGLGNLIAMADVMLLNDGTMDEFKERVRAFLTGLG
jgi:dephospho-CoA kinase